MMDIRILTVTLCLGLSVAQPPYFYGEDEEMFGCPMMDCFSLEFTLQCDVIDRYIPRMMMYGVECEICPACRDYPYYRSLINSTLSDLQEMFEKTTTMQNFLDENSYILKAISELQSNPAIEGVFDKLLYRNAEVLRGYLAYDISAVVHSLSTNAGKLKSVFNGSNAEAMSDILSDYGETRVNNMENTGEMDSSLSLEGLLAAVGMQLLDLSDNHAMIKNAIADSEAALSPLLELQEDSFDSLWSSQRTTLRVVFKLLEKSEGAVRSLLGMDVDETASSLQQIVMESNSLLTSVMETLSNDLPESTAAQENNQGNEDANQNEGVNRDFVDGVSGDFEMPCPAMDCFDLVESLPCDIADRFTPVEMMNGVECEVCPRCRDYPYYRSLLASILSDMQEMFEKTITMQSFLDENSKLLASISELQSSEAVEGIFWQLLHTNAEVLRSYLALDIAEVVDSLTKNAEKLKIVLSGSNGDSMSDILSDNSHVRISNNAQNEEGMDSSLSLGELLTYIKSQLLDLSENHAMIREAIEESEPALLTLSDLPEDRFNSLSKEDPTTLRVAFKLLEKSQDAIRSLLSMDMDQTASSVRRIVTDGYELLLSVWEGPQNDFPDNTRRQDNNEKYGEGIENPAKGGETDKSYSSDGSGDLDGSGEEWEIHDRPVYPENNLFFQWLSSRYVKLK